MARTAASLPSGSRITDYISLGVLTKAFPLDKVMAVVAAAGKTNQRQRDLPAHVVVYYRHRFDALQSGVVSRSAAVFAGRHSMVARTPVRREGGG